MTEHDPVARPAHYTSHPSGVECIQVAELQATPKARGGLKPAPSTGGTLHRLRSAT